MPRQPFNGPPVDLLRDALGQFIGDICGQPCEDEPPDAGTEP